jgi:hypothetical protein
MSAPSASCCGGSGCATARRAPAISGRTRPGLRRSQKLCRVRRLDHGNARPEHAYSGVVSEPAPAKAGDERRRGQKNPRTRRWARRTKSAPACAGAGSLGSARSVPNPAPGRRRSCRAPTRKPCRIILTRSRAAWPRSVCDPRARPGRLAHHRKAAPIGEPLLAAAAAQIPRTEPARERLAISPPEQTIEPDLRRSSGHRYRRLRCLEQSYR